MSGKPQGERLDDLAKEIETKSLYYIRCSIGPAAFLKPRTIIKNAEIGTTRTTIHLTLHYTSRTKYMELAVLLNLKANNSPILSRC